MGSPPRIIERINRSHDKMCKRASQMDANAIIGVRCQTQRDTQGVLELLCYSTAVLIQPQ
ncbi:heavy metal-binding domain-containing protein [Microcoleus sp. LAD1_D1]|uniref:heavy metal-binding domain-containing protein n=1 Tax=unclassified Microcoleus TaxID=2642155 RepID=UPI00403F7A92